MKADSSITGKSVRKFFSFPVILILMIILLTAAISASLATGPAPLLSMENRELAGEIFLYQRIPRSLTALAAGAALALCGLILQSWFRNPLAGPSVLGISSGASLGIAIAVIGFGMLPSASMPSADFHPLAGFDQNSAAALLLPLAAPIGAAAVIFPILILSSRFTSPTLLLIFGILISYLTNALSSILIHFGAAEQVKSYLSWSFGSFSGVSLKQLPFFLGTLLILTALGFLLTPGLNRLQLGRKYARSMGMRIKPFQLTALLLVSVITGLITLFCGPVAFIGIAAPHFSRSLLASSDHRKLYAVSLPAGAILALAADTACRLPSQPLPLNALLSLVGVPILFSVLLRSRSMEGSS